VAGRQHWAFQPVTDPPLPPVADTAWPLDPIDHFVLAKLQAAGLQPQPDAERWQWLRRVSLDLTGLPPSPAQIADFTSDSSPAACEKVVDRLLQSREFAERWARHWLDLTGYADQVGTSNEVFAEHAWRYRDYVINAFHQDLPWDQFVIQQIAGDLLPTQSPQQQADYLTATGFLLVGDVEIVNPDKLKLETDHIDFQLSRIGTAFLGMTLGCARCHDHKFDPVSQADYYALAGIFYSTRMLEELGTKGGEITLQRRLLVPAAVAAARQRGLALGAQLDASLASLDRGAVPPDDPERLAILAERARVAAAT
ncbi:MAG: DUF1549 domain-containing protein, partial [Planctomycetaceae bacterium]